MRLELTEVLTCPRCGPAHGMIAFVERLEAGHVLSGHVDCPHCEVRHRIRAGVLEIGSGGAHGPLPDGESDAEPEPPGDEARMADALVGSSSVVGFILVLGADPETAGYLAASRDAVVIEYVGVPSRSRTVPAGVSRILVSDELDRSRRMPFRSASLGAVVVGRGVEANPDELSRVLCPGGRLVVLAPGRTTSKWGGARGLEVLAADARALVAVRVAAPERDA